MEFIRARIRETLPNGEVRVTTLDIPNQYPGCEGSVGLAFVVEFQERNGGAPARDERADRVIAALKREQKR